MNTLQNTDNSAIYESDLLIASNDRKAVEEFILRTRSPEHGIHMQVVWEIVEGIPSETGTRVRCITPNEAQFDRLVSVANWAFVFGATQRTNQ